MMKKTCGNCYNSTIYALSCDICGKSQKVQVGYHEEACEYWQKGYFDALKQRCKQLEQVAVKLVRAHYYESEETFKGTAKELAEHFDVEGKGELADHVHTLAHPASGIVPMATYDALKQVAADMFKMHELNSRSIIPSTSRVAIDDWRDQLVELGVIMDG